MGTVGTGAWRALARVIGVVVLGIAGCAGSTADAGDVASWTVSGARTEIAEHDDEVNYVSCLHAPSGLLDMTSAVYPGGDPGITVRISHYSGPGTFEFAYSPGPLTASADVRLPGGYSYWFFYNGSFATETPSRCTMIVSEPEPGTRIHAEISCSGLVALNTSPDYDTVDAAGFRPEVSLTATFDCGI